MCNSNRMIVVLNASNQRGWGSRDHLLDDSSLTDMVGKEYKTLAGMTRAADKRSKSFPTVEYIGPDGGTWRYDGSPQSIPGRHVNRISRLTDGDRDDRDDE